MRVCYHAASMTAEGVRGGMAQAALRAHVSSWGYACFLTVNATSIWGGV